MNRLRRALSRLRSSFWFLPSVRVAAAVLLAAALTEADAVLGGALASRWPRLFGADPDGARAMLSTIAAAMMTVVGVTFSMTLMTLALVSSLYTSRILRTFLADRATQSVLGAFTAVFAYCLVVLRVLGAAKDGAVPHLAVFGGFLLALAGVGFLIFFIHHLASAIQASNIIAAVADETLSVVDRLFPQSAAEGGPEAEEEAPRLKPGRAWRPVPAERPGYIQQVDAEALLRLARERGTVARMERGIGEFVVEGAPLASLAAEGPLSEEDMAAAREAYDVERRRTMEQDCAFGIRQLVDMALRALSPGVNDTTTASMCVDYLSAILSRLAGRAVPSTFRYEEGRLRLIAIGDTFAGLTGMAFEQIRASAAGNPDILLQLLGALETIAGRTADPSRRRVLAEHAEWIAEAARSIQTPHDKARFESRLARARAVIAGLDAPALPG